MSLHKIPTMSTARLRAMLDLIVSRPNGDASLDFMAQAIRRELAKPHRR